MAWWLLRRSADTPNRFCPTTDPAGAAAATWNPTTRAGDRDQPPWSAVGLEPLSLTWSTHPPPTTLRIHPKQLADQAGQNTPATDRRTAAPNSPAAGDAAAAAGPARAPQDREPVPGAESPNPDSRRERPRGPRKPLVPQHTFQGAPSAARPAPTASRALQPPPKTCPNSTNPDRPAPHRSPERPGCPQSESTAAAPRQRGRSGERLLPDMRRPTRPDRRRTWCRPRAGRGRPSSAP